MCNLNSGVLDANRFNLSDYMNFDAREIEQGEQGIPFKLGGWQIKRAYYDGQLAEYWDTVSTQTNGIGATGPWVVGGGWNQEDAFNPENYKKDNIQEYNRSGLEQVLNTTVYIYVLKNQDRVCDWHCLQSNPGTE